jgi:NADP-dependent 3-hydroxy acid dehydrogenase YdfG
LSIEGETKVRDLKDKVAWITGAGSGIGEAGAVALAAAGMKVVLSGRRVDVLEPVAARIAEAGGEAVVEPLDISDGTAVADVASRIGDRFGRLDILVNSAGINIKERLWKDLTPEGWDDVIGIDLNGAFYCTHAVLPMMRAQKDGLVIQISSWAGRFDEYLTGAAYNAAKHAQNSMTATLNKEEFANGIRGCAICPGEVATPILDKRPVPVSDEEKALMLQSEDLGATVLFVAQMDPRVCVNEILISPTHNRLYFNPAVLPPAPE